MQVAVEVLAVVLAVAPASLEPVAAVALAVALLVQEVLAVDAFAIHLSLLPWLRLVELLVVQH